jgi:iron complex outermembrane receptor protein
MTLVINQRLRYLTTLLSILLPALCLAESSIPQGEYDFLTEQDLLSDMPVVSSVTGLDQSTADTPASITIIDRQMIRTSGAVELADVFRLVPGIQVYHVNGNRFGVSMHGQTDEFPQRLEVQIDGRSVYLPMLSTIVWTSLGLDLDSIERIEVVRGSNVPAQGANAFLGSINIITRHPLQDNGTRVSYQTGNQDAHNFSLQHNNRVGPIDFRLNASHQENNGFSNLRDGRDSDHISLRSTYSPDIANQFELQLGYSHDIIGVGDGDDPDGFTENRFDTNYQYLDWKHTFSNGDQLGLHFYHNQTRMDDRTSLGLLSAQLAGLNPADFGAPPGFVVSPADIGQVEQEIIIGSTNNLTDRYEIGLDHSSRLNESMRLFWGSTFRYDRLKSDWLLDGRKPVSNRQSRLFGNLEWHAFSSLVFNAGMMYEHDQSVQNKISTRLAVNYHFQPKHTLRFSATRAHRAPSLLELERSEIIRFVDGSSADIQFITNPDLAEEDLDALEIGYYGLWPAAGLETDVKIYHEIINNGIDKAKTRDLPGDLVPPALINSNISNFRTHGMETQITYRPDDVTRITTNYSYAVARGQRVRADNDISTLKTRVPRHTFSRMSPVKWLGGSDLLWQSRTDLRVAFPLSDARIDGEASFVVQNLFAEDYVEFQVKNVFERRIFVQVKLNLH